MAALDYLSRAGLTVEAVADKLRVSPVERMTSELQQYIVAHKAELLIELAGTLAGPVLTAANDSPEALAWLGRVACLLGCSPAYLLERGFVDRHDLVEQHQTHPRFAANLIRSNPAWMPQPRPPEQHQHNERRQPQHTYNTAGTATPEWIAARDAFHAHALGGCPHCCPPLNRYCETGGVLRARYVSETITLETP